MKKNKIDNAKLGLFVTAGLAFLVLSLYMVGKNQMLFGDTITVNARFNNVNGLMAGNNVRYGGINVGTVKKIEIETDSTILVIMLVERNMDRYIKTNAVASIGTDGLMGDKLVNINSVNGDSGYIKSGTTLESTKPIETEEMLRTLNSTNENIAIITTNLKSITQKLNGSSSLWSLLSDTVMARNLKQSIANLRVAGENAAALTEATREIVQHVSEGKGLAGVLLSDTAMKGKLTASLGAIQKASEQSVAITAQLKDITETIHSGKGTAGKLVADSVTAQQIGQILINMQEGTDRFNQDMEALKHNFLFRGYFRREEKKNNKN